MKLARLMTVLAIGLLFAVSTARAETGSAPEEISMDGYWDFAYMSGLGGKNPPQIPLPVCISPMSSTWFGGSRPAISVMSITWSERSDAGR